MLVGDIHILYILPIPSVVLKFLVLTELWDIWQIPSQPPTMRKCVWLDINLHFPLSVWKYSKKKRPQLSVTGKIPMFDGEMPVSSH